MCDPSSVIQFTSRQYVAAATTKPTVIRLLLHHNHHHDYHHQYSITVHVGFVPFVLRVYDLLYSVECVEAPCVHNFDHRVGCHATHNATQLTIDMNRYRKSHHSTSDDATAYRSDDEVSDYAAPSESPIERFRNYIARKGIWNEDQQKALLESTRKEVIT